MISTLSHIGVDATEIAQQLVKSAIKLSPTITPALASLPKGDQSDTTDNTTSLKPFITPDGLNKIQADLDFMLPRLHDMNKYATSVSPDSLPISDSQKQLLTDLLPLLPTVETGLTQARSMRGDIGWLLGVGQPRNFLLETMDNTECILLLSSYHFICPLVPIS